VRLEESSPLSPGHPFIPKKTRIKEPITNTREIPERMGKIISCLFSFKTLKLFMASVQPLDKRSKKLIEFVLVMNINIRNHFLKQSWHPLGKIII